MIVRTGRDKGKIGEIMKLMGPKALVKGVNLYKKHQKQDQKNEAAFLVKNFNRCFKYYACRHKNKKGSRIGYQKKKDGKKVRILIKSGEQLDG